MYVDDLITGANSEEKAFEIYKLSEGRFNLRKWNSNSSKLNNLIAQDDQGYNAETTIKPLEVVIEEDKGYAKTSTGSSDNVTHKPYEVELNIMEQPTR